MAFDLDQELFGEVNGLDLETGGGQLPFASPLFYFSNGTGDERLSPVSCFGGWATNKDQLDDMSERLNLVIPAGLEEDVTRTSDRRSLAVYSARSLIVAPVAFRAAWIDSKDNKVRKPKFFPGSRRHVQMLVVLGHRPSANGGIAIWGPARLTAKGFQAKKLLEVIDEWDAHTFSIRKAVAGGARATLFWMRVGTFGEQPIFEEVGKGSLTSQITPISVNKPEMSEALLNLLWGGEPLARALVEFGRQAAAWKVAWNSESDGESYGGASGRFQDNQPDEEDQIPF